jgi:hypothetical protein
MWSEIHIPDETDLPKALENGKKYNYYSVIYTNFFFLFLAGLKTMEVFEKKITSDVKFTFICIFIVSNNFHLYNRQNQRDQRLEIRELRSPILIYRISIYQRIMSLITKNK